MSLWQQRKELLKDKNFLLFLLASFIQRAAGAMCYIVLTWHVMSYPQYHALTASLLISVCFWAPSVLFSPLAGVIVDRYQRKQVLIISSLLRMASFLSIGILLINHDVFWLCCLLNLINGTIFTIVGPAIMAFIREIVPNDKLLAANSTIDICIELANILGMGLAGVLILIMSTTTVLMIIAIGIGLGILMLLFIKQNRQDQCHLQQQSRVLQQFKEGMAYLKKRPTLTLLYMLNTLLFIQFMISPILLAPFIKVIVHGSAHDFSMAELGLCGGLIVGGFVVPWLAEKYGAIRCLCGGIVWTSSLFFLVSINRAVNMVELLYVLLGLGLPLWSVIASYSQKYTDKSMQGRVQGIFNTLSSVCLMIIYLIFGFGSAHTSIAHGYWICSLIGLLSLYILYYIAQGVDSLGVAKPIVCEIQN